MDDDGRRGGGGWHTAADVTATSSHGGQADGLEDLVGEVAEVVFANSANGFGVVALDSADGPRAAGPLAQLVPGQSVRLVGRWTEHDRYGPTFEAVYYEHAAPRSVAGVVTFLASPRFPGIGRTLAQRIVTTFGLDVDTILSREPERLAEVRGVSAELAAAVGERWREAGALGALVGRLAEVGVGAAAAHAAYRRFGEDAAALVDDDPYQLLAVPGIRWAAAERLAKAAGIAAADDRRLLAAAVTAQQRSRADAGDVAVAEDVLLAETARLLGRPGATARRALDLAVAAGRLVADDLDDGVGWYTPADLRAERGIAQEVARLVGARSRVRGAVDSHGDSLDVGAAGADGTVLTDEQAAAVRAALSRPLSILTGGPGTGKTRTVVEIVRACEGADLRVALCAPTGRAAKRLEEVTGRAATTVHRLLEARGVPGEGFVFGYGPERRLPHDLVVADEWSMTDLSLAWAVLQALDDGAHLVVVGDADQLPSVGPGAVLRDLVTAADSLQAHDGEALPVATRLSLVHRQAAASRIVTLAHQINAGRVPPLAGRDGDVFCVPERTPAIAARVAEIVAVRAPAFFGCSPADVQVLAPMYRGPAGVDALNAALKQRLNPAAGRRAVAGLHEGDRVVQTRNDAELGVANGDIGEVTATDAAARTVEVAFPQGTVVYDLEQAGDLAPAWCLTVHKAQGGEWPVVVLVCDRTQRAMLWRELVYTAVTRAARGLLLVGEPGLLAPAAQRPGSSRAGGRRAGGRRTGLAQRLRSAILEAAEAKV